MSDQKEPYILVVDDEEVSISLLQVLLDDLGLTHVKTCIDSREVMPFLLDNPVSLIILDLNMPHISGLELLHPINEDYPDIPVIVITGEDRVDTAVTCMKSGAFDYITKPVNNVRFNSVVTHALELFSLREEVSTLSDGLVTQEVKHPELFENIITRNSRIRSIFLYVEAISQSPRPVLISGESGTGKELIARAIHEASGLFGNFVAVNVAGLDDSVFSDTIFGHKPGAYTGALGERNGLIMEARNGTLFLDEIGDLDHNSQLKLFRLLQEGTYYPLGSDKPLKSFARIIAATNAELEKKQEDGSFRKDLYFRIASHKIHLPPLRERLEDIPLLLDYFVEQSAKTLGKTKPTYPKELPFLLKEYNYPGNVRELQSIIFDALTVNNSSRLNLHYFENYFGSSFKQQPREYTAEELPLIEQLIGSYGRFPRLKEIEDLLINEALSRTSGNQSMAGRLLGISQSTLSRRLSKEIESIR